MIVLCIFVLELEAIAAEPPPSKQFVMSPSEAKFIAYLITRHGNNYKVCISTEYRLVEDTLLCIVLLYTVQKMVRDKKNYNQLTEGQLKKKCLHFHKSSYVYLLDSDD